MYSKTIEFNTEPILNEINNVIKNGLSKLLGDHLNRYELLEKTHSAIMNLPSVMSELNQTSNIHNLNTQEMEKGKEKEKDFDVKSIMLLTENFVKVEVNKQYESIIPLFEKMLTKIENLTNEVNELKNKDKNVIDLTIKQTQIKVESFENENIKLEIEENSETSENNSHLL